MSATSSEKEAEKCTVYYDGTCPLCQREINLYQTLDRNSEIRWHDVGAHDTNSDDLPAQLAMARFHVRRADGTLVSGAEGFFEVMKAIPRLHWLGSVLSTPPLLWIAEGLYRLFLPLRPLLKKIIPPARQKPRHDG